MTPIFTFVAYSNTGKTTYIESVIAELSSRGVRVAAVKHDGHRLELDKEGKDSWRFAKAGAKMVAVSSEDCCAIMEYRHVDFWDIIGSIHDVDVIIVEGWHAVAPNKIAIYRSTSGKPIKIDPAECIAVVSDVEIDSAGAPLLPLGDPNPMADFIMNRI